MSADAGQPVVLAIQNDPTDPPLLVGQWLEDAGLEVRVVRADAGESVPQAVPAGVHGLLPLGGSMGANDDEDAPWLPAERALLADAVRRGVPVLGLCLGSQLLAAATGGRVQLGSEAEIGVVRVQRTSAGAADPVIGALPADEAVAAHWHQDYITDLPEGAELLLTNGTCRVQAFRIDEAYGLQMHPEVTAEAFAEWASIPDAALRKSGRDAQQVVDEAADAEAALIATWRPVALAWAELVRRHAGA